MAMTRKELKQLIKEHKVKQVCSIPEFDTLNSISQGASIIYKHVDKDIYICVKWCWYWSSSENKIIAKQVISESDYDCFMQMQDDLAKMHADPKTIEAVHRFYIKCTDIMNDNYPGLHSMEDKLCAKYVRKACDYFIHDRRYHI